MMTVTIYLNESPDHFDGYHPDHAVEEVFSFEWPGVPDPHLAAEWAYQVCNMDTDMAPAGITRDTVTAYRELRRRSLSKGDVVWVRHAVPVGDTERVHDTWLAVDSAFTELPVPPIERITLTLVNRDQVIKFVDGEFHHAHEPDDPGSDVVIVELIGREAAVVILGETVTRRRHEFTIGRGDDVRDWFLRIVAEQESNPA